MRGSPSWLADHRPCPEISAELDIEPHMVNLSLGIHGRTDRLPPADIREFSTMCGHGVVSPHLVKDMIRRVKTGKVSEWDGACSRGTLHLRDLQPCRSAELLREKAPLYTVDAVTEEGNVIVDSLVSEAPATAWRKASIRRTCGDSVLRPPQETPPYAEVIRCHAEETALSRRPAWKTYSPGWRLFSPA